jgi:hypothetical protein
MSHHTEITPPLATRGGPIPDWERCAAAGCTGTRVLGSQGCRQHRGLLTRATCHRLDAYHDVVRASEVEHTPSPVVRDVLLAYLELVISMPVRPC